MLQMILVSQDDAHEFNWSNLICPLVVSKSTVNKEIPFSILAILAISFLANDFLIDKELFNSLTRIDGLILILFFSIFIYYTFGITKEKKSTIKDTIEDFKEDSPKEHGIIRSSGMIIFGLIS